MNITLQRVKGLVSLTLLFFLLPINTYSSDRDVLFSTNQTKDQAKQSLSDCQKGNFGDKHTPSIYFKTYCIIVPSLGWESVVDSNAHKKYDVILTIRALDND